MKKTFLIILSCVLSVVLLCGTLTACRDDDPSKEPIIGTWLCEDTENGAAYYVEISAKEYDKSDPSTKTSLNWTLYRVLDWYDRLLKKATDLNIDQEVKGRYSVFCDFRSIYNIRDDYDVEMSGKDTFIVTGTYSGSSIPEDIRLEFKRTTITAEQFEAQYLNG